MSEIMDQQQARAWLSGPRYGRFYGAAGDRVAHHDSLLDQDIAALFGDMLEIAGWIEPHGRAWLEAHTGAVAIARQVIRYRDPHAFSLK